jgi:hypothetical protein
LDIILGAFLAHNAIGYAKFRSRSHDAVIRVYDEAVNVIVTVGSNQTTSIPGYSASALLGLSAMIYQYFIGSLDGRFNVASSLVAPSRKLFRGERR